MKRLYWLIFAGLIAGFPSSTFSQALSVHLDTSHIYFDPQEPSIYSLTLSGSIRNLTDDTISVEFIRTQNLAKGWTTNVCFGLNCYAEEISRSTEVWAPKENRGLKVLINVPPSPIGEAMIGLVIRSRAGDSVYYDLSASALPWEPIECRMLRFYNDDTSRFEVSRVWLSDSANFSLVPQFELPNSMRKNSYADYELCLKPTDGKEYTTTVYYGNDTSVRSTNVTMKAVLSASVTGKQSVGRSWLLTNVVSKQDIIIYNTWHPQPEAMKIQILDASGKMVYISEVYSNAGKIEIPSIDSGFYIVTFSIDGKPIVSEKLIVR